MGDQRLLGARLGFTEGPLWTADGRLLVTSVSRGQVREIDLDGGGALDAIETGGGPNGLAEDAAGRIWVAQSGGRTMPTRSGVRVAPGLQRIEGRLGSTAVTEEPTSGLRAPNDLVAGPDGRIWFTDPGPHDEGPGQVYAHDPGTGTTTLIADGIDYPNGLLFVGDVLLVAETRTGAVLAVTGGATEVFATLPGGGDGMALAADGRILVAVPDRDLIAVLAPDGSALEPIRFAEPAFPTNLCFAGPDLDVLVVTAAKGGRVLALDGIGRGAPA
ncbi:SMP-30/gluconolactonase/LRE family protein [Pseudonocardia ailaonensis]|uniref:SMP-30/gluconolactonase/LRE family protein n=1 Tax=Pseudonocardia ailaonensis TaxID=367279 RepID=A0ABN2N386_9PSEU